MKKLILLIVVLVFTMPAFAAVLVGKVDVQKVLVSVKQGAAVRKKE